MNLNKELNYLLKSNPPIIGLIQLGMSIAELKSCINEELYINQNAEDGKIATIEGVELYFSKLEKLYMWIIKPSDKDFYFSIKDKKFKMNKVTLRKFLFLLSALKIEWVFDQKYCFLDQICVSLRDRE